MSRSISLTDQQKQKMQLLMDASDKSGMYLIALWHLSKGQSFTDVAKMCFLTPEELKAAVEDFHKNGLEAFSREKWYRRKNLKTRHQIFPKISLARILQLMSWCLLKRRRPS